MQIDEEISTLEATISSKEVAADYERLSILCAELEEKKKTHEALFTEWADLSE